ncbi:MAG: hypothetical protein AB8B80_14950 [Marinicellaceae bacterium]
MKNIILITAIFLLPSCVSTEFSKIKNNYEESKIETADAKKLMLGQWCGKHTDEDGSHAEWTVNRFKDGTYQIDFMEKNKNGVEDHWGEFGVWGIRLPIYFTASQGFIENEKPYLANTEDSSLYDAYKVVELTDSFFTYDSYTSGNRFTVTRDCSD